MPTLRSQFLWHCAKSSRPIEGNLVHLYLPQGQRIEGYSDGSNVFFVTHVFTKHGNEVTGKALEARPWMTGIRVNETAVDFMGTTSNDLSLQCMNKLMNSFAVDLRRLVGNQIVACSDFHKEWDKDHQLREKVVRSTKLVLDREYDPEDRYETLRPSFQSVFSGLRGRRL